MKKLALVLSLALVFAMAACTRRPSPTPSMTAQPSSIAGTPTPTTSGGVLTTQSPSPTDPNAPVEPLEMGKSLKLVKDFVAKDATVVAKLTVQYPQFKNPNNASGISKINSFFKEKFDGDVASFSEFYNDLLSGYEQQGPGNSADVNETSQSDFTITFNRNGTISMTNTVSVTGGAHPDTKICGYNFDAVTGKELQLTDLFSVSENKAALRIADEIFKQSYDVLSGGAGKKWTESIKTAVRQNCLDSQYYITEDGLVLLIDPLVIEAITFETIDLKINFSDLADMIKITMG